MSNDTHIGISLDLVNRHFQEPNRNRYESRYYWDELYPLIAQAGFNAIELPYELFWMFRGGSGVPMTRYCLETKFGSVSAYLKHLRSFGIERIAGVHFDPTMFMRNNSLDFYFGASGHFAQEALDFAFEAGCDYLNLTPTPPVGLLRHYHPSDAGANTGIEAAFIARTAELIQRLAASAKQQGIKLTLRHEYWSVLRGEAMQTFLGQLDDTAEMDADCAHLSISGEDPVAFVHVNSCRIGTAHLTDTAFVDDADVWKSPLPEFPQHRATQVFRDPGQGAVDIGGFYRALTSAGFDGWAILSCRQTRDPMRALLRSGQLVNNTLRAV